MRRSFACMLAGLMIVGPLVVAWEWHPHTVAVIALVYVWIGGVMLLYEELAAPFDM